MAKAVLFGGTGEHSCAVTPLRLSVEARAEGCGACRGPLRLPLSLRHRYASTLLAEGAPLTAVAGHLGDTVDTVSRTYVHWLRDDRDVPAEVLDRMLAPVAEATGLT